MTKDELIDAITDELRKRGHHKGEGHQSGASVNFVLFFIYNHGGKAYPGEMKERMGVSTPRITAILNDQEEKGYIRRIPEETDRRKVVVMLTDEGLERVHKLRAERRAEVAEIIDIVGESDGAALLRILIASRLRGEQKDTRQQEK